MRDILAKKKRWNLLEKEEKVINGAFEVEKEQLKILIDFFCYDEIFDVLINNMEWFSEDANGSSIKDLLDNQISNLCVTLKQMSIKIQNKFDRLYWDCLEFGYDIKVFQADIYHIRKCLIEEITDNKFHKDPELVYGILCEISSTLEKIEMNVEFCPLNV